MTLRPLALLFTALLALGLTAPEAAHAEDPVVTVTDAGKGKKQKLRFTPKKGLKESMTMVIDMNMEMAMGGQQMPAQDLPSMTMVMETEVNEVKGDGSFTYSFKFTKMDVADSDTLPPSAVEEMRKSLGGMVGMEGHATMTARGFSRDGDFVLPETASAEIRETMDNMTQSMDQMVSPLPEEPVGVGAKWTVKTKVSSSGMKIDQEGHYTLLSLSDDGTMELEVTLTQKADKQTVDLGAQGSFDLVRYTGGGAGNTILNLSKIMPVDANIDVQNDAGMAMDMGGQAMEMGVKSKVKNTMKGEVRQ